MSLGMVAVWGLLVYGVVWLVRGGTAEPKPTPLEPPPAVLKRRLAAGEISVEEYDQLREALRDDERHAVGV